MNEMMAGLTAVKSDLATLNQKVDQLTEEFEQHKNQTTTELARIQSSITNPPIAMMSRAVLQSLLPYLNDIEEDLGEKVDESVNSLAGDLEEINEKVCNLSDRQMGSDQTINSKLDLMYSKQGELDMKVLSVNSNLEDNVLSNVTKQLQRTSYFLHESLGPICDGTGGWRRVVYLNMTDPNTNCPSGWELLDHSKITCGRGSVGSLTCDSVSFRVDDWPYTSVCGTIRAYQNGHTDAFEAYDTGEVTTIDGAYVSGVSLTHGNPRQHIWTFAAGASESYNANEVCPCDTTFNITIPSFVGGDYFCESGANSWATLRFHSNDPLWDGKGCTRGSTCCSFNNPPYFTKRLPNPTTDYIEARICQKDAIDDTPIEFMELYVK